MEELYFIIRELTEKYTGGDSTSVPVEIAEQLAEAVSYCIDEIWDSSGDLVPENQKICGVYEAGRQKVLDQVIEAQQLYSKIMEDFDSYGNRALQETVADGMPKFFLYYDADFSPQNHILTLDYPVLTDLGELRGVHRILTYLKCIQLEQNFLTLLPRDYVLEILKKHHQSYRVLLVNLPGIVLRKLLANSLLELPPWRLELTPDHYGKLVGLIRQQGRENLELTLFDRLKSLTGGERELFQYLKRVLPDIAAEFVNGAEHTCLERMV